MRLRSLLSTAALLSAGLMFTTSSHASTLISVGLQQAGVNSGNITTVTTDGGTGSAQYSGTYGSYVFNSITATGSPILAPGSLGTTSLQATTSAAAPGGTFYVYITEQGLTSPTGLTSFLSTFTSQLFSGAATSVLESTYYSTANLLFSGTQLASHTFTGLDTAMSSNLATLSGPYSETVRYAITAGPGVASVNDTINLTATAATPEPSSLALLGTGLIGTATMVLRRRKLIA